MFQSYSGVRMTPGLLGTVARNPRLEREVKFAPYFLPGDRQAVGSICYDRAVSAERHPVRCSNLS